jgi:hypothetical protein
MRTSPNTLTIADGVGTSARVTRFTSQGGAVADGATIYAATANDTSYYVALYTQSKYGFYGAVRADAEL